MGILGLIIARQHMFLYPILVTVQTAVVTMRHQYLVRVQLKATGCQKIALWTLSLVKGN
jgi:hypothetical protein